MPSSTRSRARARRRTKAAGASELRDSLTLARTAPVPFRPDSLRRWSDRLGVGARRACWLAGRLPELDLGEPGVAIRRFISGGARPSALDMQPRPWLRLTETQISRPLAGFLAEGGPDRVMAFLRALPCRGVELPIGLEDVRAQAEVPAKGGRIDLLVTGRSGRSTYGAAIEIKIDHTLHNPLGSYARVAAAEGLRVAGRAPGRSTGALIVLARTSTAATRKRLSRNRGWRFVHWSAFLRRFERQLARTRDDDDFRAYRRLVWDRLT